MNLAIDLFIETESLIPKVVNRTIDDDVQANGKGANVSIILKKLGIDNTAIGFSGGFTGKYIQDFLSENQISTHFIDVPGLTRINVFTQVNEESTEYKLVNRGPYISPKKLEALLSVVRSIQKDDYLFVSGSFPQGVSPDILIEISQIAQKNKFHLIIDSNYNQVMDCLVYKPFLLKPNEEELAEWFGVKEITIDTAPAYLKKLIEKGAQRVLLSLGAEGSIYMDDEVLLYGNAPKGKVINTACAGDTLLATFVKGLIKEEDLEDTLKYSIAAGSSTAFSKGLTDFNDVEQLTDQIEINKI
jgi:1-phosphofructokinase